MNRQMIATRTMSSKNKQLKASIHLGLRNYNTLKLRGDSARATTLLNALWAMSFDLEVK